MTEDDLVPSDGRLKITDRRVAGLLAVEPHFRPRHGIDGDRKARAIFANQFVLKVGSHSAAEQPGKVFQHGLHAFRRHDIDEFQLADHFLAPVTEPGQLGVIHAHEYAIAIH